MSDCDSWDGQNKVQELASTLQDANRNLRAVDRMLGEYREVTDRPTRRRPHSAGVRFDDSIPVSPIRRLQQSVRDLATGQARLEQDFHDEVTKRRPLSAASGDNEVNLGSLRRQIQNLEEELRSSRQNTHYSDVMSNISPQLREALNRRPNQHDEIDHIKRRLEQSETSRKNLQTEIEQLKSRPETSRRLEDEVRELKNQLNRSTTSVNEFGSMQKELDSSEKQRRQLSSHLENLSREVEEKEKFQAKVIRQLHTANEKSEEADRRCQHTLLQLEDAVRQIRDYTARVDSAEKETNSVRQQLAEAEKSKAEAAAFASHTIKQWKNKVRKLEKEVDGYAHTSHEATKRCEQLVRELESMRGDLGTYRQQADRAKAELAHVLAARAALDEAVRAKDIGLNENKAARIDAEKDAKDSRSIADRLERELHAAGEKISHLREERCKLEDHINGLNTGQQMAHSQLQSLHKEVKELAACRMELTSQLAEAAKQRSHLLRQVEECHYRFKKEQDEHKEQIISIKNEIEEKSAYEKRRMKQELAEANARIQTLRIELEEERSNSAAVRSTIDGMKVEIDRLHTDLEHSERMAEESRKKYYEARQNFLNSVTNEEHSENREIERMLLHAEDKLHSEREYIRELVSTLAADLDDLLLNLSKRFSSLKPPPSTLNSSGDISKWIQEAKSSLSWIKSEVAANFVQRPKSEEYTISNPIPPLEPIALQPAEKEDSIVDEFDINYKRQLIHDRYEKLQELVTSLKSEVEENKNFGLESVEY